MSTKLIRATKVIMLFFLLIGYSFFLAQKIDLTRVDLGRHLKNGELLISSIGKFDMAKIKSILYTNFYSYTHPDYPFINHHWLGGIILFLIFRLGGFIGLSLFYIILSISVFLLFFYITKKSVGFKISAILSLLLIPLLTERTEIRPEAFSYFFSAIFFWILWHYRYNSISYRWLFILPLIEIIWVNTHIYFFLGWLLIAIFLLEELIVIRFKERIKKYSFILILTIIATLFNPFGLKGIFYPFNILNKYGYQIVENQSVWFLEKLKIIYSPNFFLFKIVFLMFILSSVFLIITNRKSFSIMYFCLGLVFGAMACLQIRNFSIFGFFILPILGFNIKSSIFQKIDLNYLLFFVLGLFIFTFTFLNNYKYLVLRRQRFGIGLCPENNRAAEFFKKQDIKGPIFNNYDIGSYLIYHLYPKQCIFVDNRPEAYPDSFFKDVYIPIQENGYLWEMYNKIYNFNVIFFSYHDLTPWGQKFLFDRINDPAWAVVFADSYAIIFLKKNTLNQSLITKYGIIPKIILKQ